MIFCDICDFTALVRLHDPLVLVLTLDVLFRKFDRLCDKHDVSKIETVAETFLAASGLEGSSTENPAQQAAQEGEAGPGTAIMGGKNGGHSPAALVGEVVDQCAPASLSSQGLDGDGAVVALPSGDRAEGRDPPMAPAGGKRWKSLTIPLSDIFDLPHLDGWLLDQHSLENTIFLNEVFSLCRLTNDLKAATWLRGCLVDGVHHDCITTPRRDFTIKREPRSFSIQEGTFRQHSPLQAEMSRSKGKFLFLELSITPLGPSPAATEPRAANRIFFHSPWLLQVEVQTTPTI